MFNPSLFENPEALAKLASLNPLAEGVVFERPVIIHRAVLGSVERMFTARTLNKMVREAQLAQYNFILVVGSSEEEADSVNVRTLSLIHI